MYIATYLQTNHQLAITCTQPFTLQKHLRAYGFSVQSLLYVNTKTSHTELACAVTLSILH